MLGANYFFFPLPFLLRARDVCGDVQHVGFCNKLPLIELELLLSCLPWDLHFQKRRGSWKIHNRWFTYYKLLLKGTIFVIFKSGYLHFSVSAFLGGIWEIFFSFQKLRLITATLRWARGFINSNLITSWKIWQTTDPLFSNTSSSSSRSLSGSGMSWYIMVLLFAIS